MNATAQEASVSGSSELESAIPRTRSLGARFGDVRNKVILVGLIVGISVIASIASPAYLTWINWKDILESSSIGGILACGMTMLMVSGGIDLSIGSAVSFTAVVMAEMMVHNVGGTLVAIVTCCVLGGIIGLLNGLLISRSRAHPFILTLGGLSVWQGAALMVSANPIQPLPTGFLNFTFKQPLGLPIVIWFFIAALVLSQLTLSRTVYGRYLYAIGGSEPAARLAGIPVATVKVVSYLVMGLLVGVAAVLMTSQLSSAQALQGQGLELSVIAAVAIGGTPLAGGRGDVIGTALGILLIQVISDALNLLNVNSNLGSVIIGLIIVAAVIGQRYERSGQ